MPNTISSRIPSISHKLDEIATLPHRDPVTSYGPAADFPLKPSGPGRSKMSPARRVAVMGEETRHIETRVNVIGNGWTSLIDDTAAEAAQNKVSTYDREMDKVGKGQIGTTGIDLPFNLPSAAGHALVMPHFTERQLGYFPPITRQTAELEKYSALARKHLVIRNIQMDHSLPFSERRAKYDRLFGGGVPKRDFIESRAEVRENSEVNNGMKLTICEVDGKMVRSMIEDKGEAVILATSNQINLEHSEFKDIVGHPRFLPEMILGSASTEKLFDGIRAEQAKLSEEYPSTQEIPLDRLPSVTVLGSGPIAQQNILDLLSKIDPEMIRLTWLRGAEKSAESTVKTSQKDKFFIDARKVMKSYEFRAGHVSDFQLSDDGRRVNSVFITDRSGNISKERVDLYIHTEDYLSLALANSKVTKDVEDAYDALTKRLEIAPVGNAIIRSGKLVGNVGVREIHQRIESKVTFSMRDDMELISQIEDLVALQNSGIVPTIVVSGSENSNFYSKRMAVLAALSGYRSNIIHCELPAAVQVRDEHAEFEKLEQSFGDRWKNEIGRLEKVEADSDTGGLNLQVRTRQEGDLVTLSTGILVGGGSKTSRTKLIEELIDLKLAGTHVRREPFRPDVHSLNELLIAQTSVFDDEFDRASGGFAKDVEEYLGITCHPDMTRVRPEPTDWERIFEFSLAYREKKLVEMGVLPPEKPTQFKSPALIQKIDRAGSTSASANSIEATAQDRSLPGLVVPRLQSMVTGIRSTPDSGPPATR